MKLLACCLLLVFCLNSIDSLRFHRLEPPEVDSLEDVQTFWFDQILDHFDTNNTTYWKQKYDVNEAIWNITSDSSPVFLMVGGESATSLNWMKGGAWVEWAYNYGALLFQLEHRFYGDSHPTPDTSIENLKYLTSQQAIQDISYFIDQMNKQYNFTSSKKWILFGGSYPGNLVAWARLKLPEQVYGGVSSSGPLMAETDFYQYMDVVRDSLDAISPGCSSAIPKAIESIQDTMASNGGESKVTEKFNVCTGFSTSFLYDSESFYEALSGGISAAVQYNGQSFTGPKNIRFICDNFLNNQSIADPVDRLAALIKNNLDWYYSTCFLASNFGTITYYQNTDWNSTANSKGGRPWLYQTCNEFGYYQTSENTTSLFRNTFGLQFYLQQCEYIFGIKAADVQKNVDKTNEYYHGTDIDVERVVFVQGSIDPWHALGMVKNPTSSSPFIYIHGSSHCQDMLGYSIFDSPALTNAKVIINQNLAKWLS